MELQGFINVTPALTCGVYALVHQGKVVYIGQAKAMLVRICTHRSNARKKVPSWLPATAKGIIFDEVHIQPCHPDRIDDLEHALISFYKPKMNTLLKYAGAGRVKAPLTITTASGAAIVLGGFDLPKPAVSIERRL